VRGERICQLARVWQASIWLPIPAQFAARTSTQLLHSCRVAGRGDDPDPNPEPTRVKDADPEPEESAAIGAAYGDDSEVSSKAVGATGGNDTTSILCSAAKPPTHPSSASAVRGAKGEAGVAAELKRAKVRTTASYHAPLCKRCRPECEIRARGSPPAELSVSISTLPTRPAPDTTRSSCAVGPQR
jgi:hypothetical protein